MWRVYLLGRKPNSRHWFGPQKNRKNFFLFIEIWNTTLKFSFRCLFFVFFTLTHILLDLFFLQLSWRDFYFIFNCIEANVRRKWRLISNKRQAFLMVRWAILCAYSGINTHRTAYLHQFFCSLCCFCLLIKSMTTSN